MSQNWRKENNKDRKPGTVGLCTDRPGFRDYTHQRYQTQMYRICSTLCNMYRRPKIMDLFWRFKCYGKKIMSDLATKPDRDPEFKEYRKIANKCHKKIPNIFKSRRKNDLNKLYVLTSWSWCTRRVRSMFSSVPSRPSTC